MSQIWASVAKLAAGWMACWLAKDWHGKAADWQVDHYESKFTDENNWI